MDFYDEDLKLQIFDEVSGSSISFKAYLENSSLDTSIIEQQLPFAPLSFTNDSIHTRTIYKINLVFNVFSEDRDEAIVNFDNLHKILDNIKPKYSKYNSQYIPDKRDQSGLMSIKFKGLPKISNLSGVKNQDTTDNDRLRIHINNFSYSIINDMGFIHLPYDADNINDQKETYVKYKMRLVPVAYKLAISGKILLEFEDTIKLVKNIPDPADAIQRQNRPTARSENDFPNKKLQGILQNNGKLIDNFLSTTFRATNLSILSAERPDIFPKVINIIDTAMKGGYLIESNGTLIFQRTPLQSSVDNINSTIKKLTDLLGNANGL